MADTRKAPSTRTELQNLEAERAVLSAVLTSPAQLLDLSSELSTEEFASPGHQALWRAIEAVDAGGQTVDEITVAEQLRQTRDLELVGGPEYLQQLLEEAAPTGHLPGWVRIVTKKAQLRRTYEAAYKIASDALAPDADEDEVLSNAEASMLSVSSPGRSNTIVTMAQAIAETQAEMEKARTRDLLGHSTGIKRLDDLTHGLQPGQLVLIAARPAMGKSALALNIANHISETTGDLVYYASYEMSTTELTMRLLANYSGIPLNELKTGKVPTELERDFAVQAAKVGQLSLLMNSRPPQTVHQLRSELRRVSRRGPLAAVFVDYLQLMHGSQSRREDSRAQEVSEISRGLKEIAMELELPVIALSQLNRGVESRTDKRPMLSDLRESGSLEQDADTVWMLYRESVYNDAAPQESGELNIVKQRSGPTGNVPLHFVGNVSRFTDGGTPSAIGSGRPARTRSGAAAPFS